MSLMIEFTTNIESIMAFVNEFLIVATGLEPVFPD